MTTVTQQRDSCLTAIEQLSHNRASAVTEDGDPDKNPIQLMAKSDSWPQRHADGRNGHESGEKSWKPLFAKKKKEKELAVTNLLIIFA